MTDARSDDATANAPTVAATTLAEPRPRVRNRPAYLREALAPEPAIDKWPIILGTRLNLSYLSSVFRLALTGYRQQMVDALGELLEKECHAACVLAQRTLAIASGRVELTSAVVSDLDGKEAERAHAIRDDVQRRYDAIPNREAALYGLVFSALFYGAGGLENYWTFDTTGWNVDRLGFIHSRRINAPVPTDWSPRIWDQGQVGGADAFGQYPTEAMFGIRCDDVPGKFIIHTEGVRGDYWLREGLGRALGYCMAIKLLAVRGAGDFVERFSKPWALAYYNTGEPSQDGKPRVADEDDIAAADTALAAIGAGSLTSATLPDSIKVTLDGPAIKAAAGSINHEKLIDIMNGEMSKLVRGATLTTDTGTNGNKNLGTVHADGDVRNARHDGACLAATLKESLISWLFRLNYPSEPDTMCPGVVIHVEKVDPDQILARYKELAAMGARPDGKVLADLLGVKLSKADDTTAVPLAPLKPVDLFALTASATDLPSAIEGIAAIVGISVTPAMKTAIAEMDRDDVARLIQDLLGAAKADESAVAAEGAAAEGVAPTTAKKTKKPTAGVATKNDPTTPPAKGDATTEDDET